MYGYDKKTLKIWDLNRQKIMFIPTVIQIFEFRRCTELQYEELALQFRSAVVLVICLLVKRFLKRFEKIMSDCTSFSTIHSYADDTQLYMSFKPIHDADQTIARIESCICEIREWMTENFLKLNDDKTEFILIGSIQVKTTALQTQCSTNHDR